jgi:hypothetical protein
LQKDYKLGEKIVDGLSVEVESITISIKTLGRDKNKDMAHMYVITRDEVDNIQAT